MSGDDGFRLGFPVRRYHCEDLAHMGIAPYPSPAQDRGDRLMKNLYEKLREFSDLCLELAFGVCAFGAGVGIAFMIMDLILKMAEGRH